ncbi:hypothetical protein TrRE_jg9057, partial [Triparma retinervis]
MIGSALVSEERFRRDLPSRVMTLLGWQVFLAFNRVGRRRLSRVPDRQLNDFLVKNLIVEGFSGLGPIVFLIFDTVRCANEVYLETDSLDAIEKQCRRTLIAQLFLGGFYGVYTMARLFVACVPIGIVKKHYVSVYELATFSLSIEKLGLVILMLVILMSTMYLVGNIGAESSMSSVNELFTFGIGFSGLGAICSIVVWKLFVLQRDINEIEGRDDSGGEDNKDGGWGEVFRWHDENISITSINCAYSYVIMVGSAVYLTLCILFFVTLDDKWDIFLHNAGPIIHGSFALSIFFDVRNQKRSYQKIFLYGHFVLQIALPEVLLVVAFTRKGNLVELFISIFRISVEFILYFKVALRLRMLLQKLPDRQLDRMYRWIITVGAPSGTPLLYLAFKGMRCFIENTEGIEVCTNTALVVGHLSIYIVGFVIVAFMVVVGTGNRAREHWLERFATLDLSHKEKVEALFTALAVACGLFLFSNINNENGDLKYFYVCGSIGSLSVGTVLFFESKSTISQLTNYDIDQEGRAKREKPLVTELSLWFNAVAFSLVAVVNSFFIIFAITGDERMPVFGTTFTAIAGSAFIFSVLFQPRNNSRLYFVFLVLFFLFTAVPGEIAPAIHSLKASADRKGFTLSVLPYIRILITYAPLFWLLLKLRRYVSRLEDQELGTYLCHYVLRRWYATLVPMLFLSFETIACIFEDGGVSVEFCAQSGCASMFLSINILLMNIFSLVQKSASKR